MTHDSLPTSADTMLSTLARRIASGAESATVDVAGFQVTARVVDDADSRPSDSDGYTHDQIAAWHAGGWRFIGIELSVGMTGVEASGAIFCIERGMVDAAVEADSLETTVLRALFQEARDDLQNLADAATAALARIGG